MGPTRRVLWLASQWPSDYDLGCILYVESPLQPWVTPIPCLVLSPGLHRAHRHRSPCHLRRYRLHRAPPYQYLPLYHRPHRTAPRCSASLRQPRARKRVRGLGRPGNGKVAPVEGPVRKWATFDCSLITDASHFCHTCGPEVEPAPSFMQIFHDEAKME